MANGALQYCRGMLHENKREKNSFGDAKSIKLRILERKQKKKVVLGNEMGLVSTNKIGAL